jgi:hypothetical protein
VTTRDELRAAQQPLKARYRDEPASARLTLRAEGSLGEGVSCSVATGSAMAEATSLEIPVRGGTVRAEGDLDFRGTLAVSRDVPVGLTAVRLHFDLDTDATEEQLETLLRLTKRYCVVYQTLAAPPGLSVSADVVRR